MNMKIEIYVMLEIEECIKVNENSGNEKLTGMKYHELRFSNIARNISINSNRVTFDDIEKAINHGAEEIERVL